MTDPLDRLWYRGRWPGGPHAWSDPAAPEIGAFDAARPLAEFDAAIAEIRAWNARLTSPSVAPSKSRKPPAAQEQQASSNPEGPRPPRTASKPLTTEEP